MCFSNKLHFRVVVVEPSWNDGWIRSPLDSGVAISDEVHMDTTLHVDSIQIPLDLVARVSQDVDMGANWNEAWIQIPLDAVAHAFEDVNVLKLKRRSGSDSPWFSGTI